MSRRCELTGKGVLTGNNVSHAHNKTRRRFLPNLQRVSLHSDMLNQTVRFRVAASTLRTVDRKGGLDLFLLDADPRSLSTRARALRTRLEKRQASA